MSLVRLKMVGAATIVAAGSLLFVDLFLRWRDVSVDVGVTHTAAGSTGWARWGIPLGIVLILLVLREGAGFGLLALDETIQPRFVTAILSVAVLGFTVAQIADSASVRVGAMVDVETGTLRWPAWVGLGLAIVVALAGLVPFLVEALRGPPVRRHVPRPL